MSFKIYTKQILRIFLCIVIACICITFVYNIDSLEVVQTDRKLFSDLKENLQTLFYKSPIKGNARERENISIAANQSGVTDHNKEVTVSCNPHHRFAFIKTHKTGSSTIKQLFGKQTRKNSLKHEITAPGPFVGGYPGHIKKEFVFMRQNGHVQSPVKEDEFVLNNHFRFNYTVLKEIMPPGTKFISIIREPLKQLQSSFHYYYKHSYPIELGKPNCFQYPFFHIAKGGKINFTTCIHLAYKNLNESVPWFFRIKNYQAFDLGLDPLLEDEKEIEKEIKRLDSEFDLMMITDYMEESLILLKEKMCLDWSDVVHQYANQNTRYVPLSFSSDSSEMKKFRKIDNVDIALYNHFNATLWRKVDAYGRERMNRDIAKLRSLQHHGKKEATNQPYVFSDKTSRAKFKEFSKNIFDHDLMLRILKRKMHPKLDGIIGAKNVDNIASYMIESQGGCPI